MHSTLMRHVALGAAFSTLGIVSLQAQAQKLSYHLEGNVSFFLDEGILDGSIVPGSGFTVQFMFDPTTPDSDASANRGRYVDNSVGSGVGTVQIGSYQFVQTSGNLEIEIGNNMAPGVDTFSIQGGNYQTTNNLEIVGSKISWIGMADFTQTTFASDELPFFAPPLNRFQEFSSLITLRNPQNDLRATLFLTPRSLGVAPEPGAMALLFASGIAGTIFLSALRRR